jgi:4-hydroxy-tetrahydrodipicolinate synthase
VTSPGRGLGAAIVPLVTPFGSAGDVDVAALGRLVDHFLEQGADALMPTALTGEGPLLSETEILRVWERTFESARGRAPVHPAIISFTTDSAVRLARRAEELGGNAILLAPLVPELYAGRSERDVFGFYETVADATGLSIILFNYPSLTGVDLTPPLVEKLAAIETVRYIKESTGDSRRISALKRRLGERIEVVCGAPTNALESLALGCTSWITGILNVVPRSGRQLLRAIHELRDLDLARRIYFEQILPLVDAMEKTSNPTGTIKAGLRARGLDVGIPRRPGQDLLAAERVELEKTIEVIARIERQHETS